MHLCQIYIATADVDNAMNTPAVLICHLHDVVAQQRAHVSHLTSLQSIAVKRDGYLEANLEARLTLQPFLYAISAMLSPSSAHRIEPPPSTTSTRPSPASSKLCYQVEAATGIDLPLEAAAAINARAEQKALLVQCHDRDQRPRVVSCGVSACLHGPPAAQGGCSRST